MHFSKFNNYLQAIQSINKMYVKPYIHNNPPQSINLREHKMSQTLESSFRWNCPIIQPPTPENVILCITYLYYSLHRDIMT